MKLSINCLFFS